MRLIDVPVKSSFPLIILDKKCRLHIHVVFQGSKGQHWNSLINVEIQKQEQPNYNFIQMPAKSSDNL